MIHKSHLEGHNTRADTLDLANGSEESLRWVDLESQALCLQSIRGWSISGLEEVLGRKVRFTGQVHTQTFETCFVTWTRNMTQVNLAALQIF